MTVLEIEKVLSAASKMGGDRDDHYCSGGDYGAPYSSRRRWHGPLFEFINHQRKAAQCTDTCTVELDLHRSTDM